VAPNVGSCREMIEGRNPAVDKPGGIITALVNPEGTARALIKLLKDTDLRREMGEALRERVRCQYDKNSIIAQYRELYSSLGDAATKRVQRPIRQRPNAPSFAG
jgi:glycosyltransferase involved in cell wall biosynthesis